MTSSSRDGGAADSSRERVAGAARSLVLGLMLLAVLFLATEAMVRVGTALLGIRLDSSYGYPAELFVEDPELGFALEPGFVGTFPNPPYDEIEIRINESGYRDRPFPPPVAAGPPRVLVLGDSITFGAGVRVEDRYTDRIRESLCGERRCEVMNAGVGSYQAENYLAVLRKQLPELDPDWVIVGFCMNDIRPKADLRDLGQVLRTGFANRIRGLLSHSQLFRIGARIVRMLTLDAEAYEQRWIRLAIEAWSDPAQRERLNGTLVEMQSLLRAHGARLAFVLFPERHQIEDFEEFGLPYAMAQEAVGALDVPVVSLLPKLEAALAEGDLDKGGIFLPGDNIHFTPEAHAWIAEVVTDELGARLLGGGADRDS